MRNPIRMTLLCGAAIFLPTWHAEAQTPGQCAIAPTCSELGYEQKASDCSGMHMLKCPFDKDKVFCGGTACAADFTLISCDTNKGACEQCGDRFKYTNCNSGWILKNGECIVNDCSAFTLSSCPSNANCSSCKSGPATKYKFSSCRSGYSWNGSSCTANTCSGYNLSYCPDNYTCSSCKSGSTTKYKKESCNLTSCFSPYVLSGCECVHTCVVKGYTNTPSFRFDEDCEKDNGKSYICGGSIVTCPDDSNYVKCTGSIIPDPCF